MHKYASFYIFVQQHPVTANREGYWSYRRSSKRVVNYLKIYIQWKFCTNGKRALLVGRSPLLSISLFKLVIRAIISSTATQWVILYKVCFPTLLSLHGKMHPVGITEDRNTPCFYHTQTANRSNPEYKIGYCFFHILLAPLIMIIICIASFNISCTSIKSKKKVKYKSKVNWLFSLKGPTYRIQSTSSCAVCNLN